MPRPSPRSAPADAARPNWREPDADVEPQDTGLEVHRQQRAIADAIGSRAAPTPTPAPRAETTAFTLRLDAERHLRLRLACAAQNCSAQQLVTQALDRFLNELPEIENLATQLKRS
ncbi:hypothetical protein GRI97_03640 [Altererythrobacter xixiisoli]|uniref:Uncharacterized protein n=1 Tax=Croceibacterium xixiisoli TaxID=1476466 RepID=A0A6I4TSF3_9SPHN|nr:hypothetical protein [Croceibacterium xixiisoli]MXO98080.1 hypothetical protein [Croceibacterium xixiisoli]